MDVKVLTYSARAHDQEFFNQANQGVHQIDYTEARLEKQTAILARDYPAICCFVQDDLSAPVLERLRRGDTRLITLRATGFNNVDIEAASRLNFTVMRVTSYSPYSVAEFAVGLVLALNRKIHRAYLRVRDGNFLLSGLLGFDLHGKTVGVIGTGRIGAVFAGIMHGFGCQLLGYDKYQNPALIGKGMKYVGLDELLCQSDVISLHIPLTPETYHMINRNTLSLLKEDAMLINTSRGELVDARALIPFLKRHQGCAIGLDVYEEESHLYYRDLSNRVIQDDVISRLISLPNVLITSHQAFFTREAMSEIAETTMKNLADFAAERDSGNILSPRKVLVTARH